ncbi:ATP synthase F1 subunit gamma [Buchnera aphidicola]|uniref:ATP synthase F1 subunit gamma n=1 Tax=Buchnera aphidicola TaxID=9 RepID=UPI0034648DEB
MTNIKNIKNKISSLINTKKITKTMEMVAISKMKKFKKKIETSFSYSKVIEKVISHVLESPLKYKHIFLIKKKIIKTIGIIVISSDKGLCGSLNSNLFKMINSIILKYSIQKIQCRLYVFGQKGLFFFKHINLFHFSNIIHLTDDINESDLIKSTEEILEQYQTNKIDKLFIASNKNDNRVSFKPVLTQILPFKKDVLDHKKNKIYKFWDYLYEPNSKIALDILLKKYILFQIFHSILENMLCEQTSRMIAMKTASDNSDNILKELQLIYNKMRQFSITQEITEIISGASLVSEN